MSSTGSSLRLEEIKAQILVSQYTNVAAATLYFYDILLTFGDEVQISLSQIAVAYTPLARTRMETPAVHIPGYSVSF